jgi:hypothetical protein
MAIQGKYIQKIGKKKNRRREGRIDKRAPFVITGQIYIPCGNQHKIYV